MPCSLEIHPSVPYVCSLLWLIHKMYLHNYLEAVIELNTCVKKIHCQCIQIKSLIILGQEETGWYEKSKDMWLEWGIAIPLSWSKVLKGEKI